MTKDEAYQMRIEAAARAIYETSHPFGMDMVEWRCVLGNDRADYLFQAKAAIDAADKASWLKIEELPFRECHGYSGSVSV